MNGDGIGAGAAPRADTSWDGELTFGTFLFDVATRTLTWTGEIFRIYGFEPSEVVPTLELLSAHQHPAGPGTIARPFSTAARRRRTLLLALPDHRCPPGLAVGDRDGGGRPGRRRDRDAGARRFRRPDRDTPPTPGRRGHPRGPTVGGDARDHRPGQGRADGLLRSHRRAGIRPAPAALVVRERQTPRRCRDPGRAAHRPGPDRHAGAAPGGVHPERPRRWSGARAAGRRRVRPTRSRPAERAVGDRAAAAPTRCQRRPERSRCRRTFRSPPWSTRSTTPV